jgi:hypothetical protein
MNGVALDNSGPAADLSLGSGDREGLNQDRVAREAADILADHTMNFSDLARQPQEQWSVAAPTMDQYQEDARGFYPDLEGNKTTEVVGRIEFLRERMAKGATSEERQQAQEKLAATFGISTNGKSDSQIQNEIEQSYRDVLNEIRDAGQEQDRNITRPDRLDAELRSLQDRLETTQEHLEKARSRVGYSRGAGRAVRTLEARERTIQRTIDERTERLTTGERTYHENMELGRAQDRVTERLTQMGRQGLSAGVDVDELFEGSRVMQREGGDMFYDPQQYAQETAEARVRIQNQRQARQGPRTITPDESTPSTSASGVRSFGSGDPLNPATYNTPSSTYIDRTGKDAEYFARREGDRRAAEDIAEVDQRVAAGREQGQKDLNFALEHLANGGDLTRGILNMDDARLDYLRGAIDARVADLKGSGQFDPRGQLATLDRALDRVGYDRALGGSEAGLSDVQGLLTQSTNDRAQAVMRMSDEKVQQLDAYLRGNGYVASSGQGELANQIAKVMSGRGLEQVQPSADTFQRRQPPTSAYQTTSVRQEPAPATTLSPKELAQNMYQQIHVVAPENRAALTRQLMGDLTDPALRTQVLAEVNKAKASGAAANPEVKATLVAMQAELTGVRDARDINVVAHRVFEAINSGMDADTVMTSITNPNVRSQLLARVEQVGGANATASATLRSMFNALA